MMGGQPIGARIQLPVSSAAQRLGGAVAHRCSQVLYRCLEEVGSTKGVLYLRLPGQRNFDVVSSYGWPRGKTPPAVIPEGHPLLVRTQRERRSFLLDGPADWPDLTDAGTDGTFPRAFVTPLHLEGTWVGLLVQRDRIKGAPFHPEEDEQATLAICRDLVTELRDHGFQGSEPAPPPVVRPVKARPSAESERPTVGPRNPEQLHGFPGGAAAYAPVPWDPDRTLSGWVAPPPPNPDRKRGMVRPELRTFFWEVAELISKLMPASAVALWIDDPEEIRPILAFSTFPLSDGLQQQLLGHATPHLPAVPPQDLRLITQTGLVDMPSIDGAFAVCMPLLLNESLRGHDLFLVLRQEEQSFSRAEIEAIQQMGRVLALHLQESRLHERYHHAFLSVSHRILQSGEGRMPSLRPHSLATARLARDLALRLGLTTEEVEAVSIAAILHDVGLLMLDPKMLAKQDLSAEELRKVRSHPELAAVFLKDLRFPFDVVRTIRHHHERWDGNGYPDRLRETAIPIGSRIIGIIEAYEVMTSGKGYRSPMGFRQALEEVTSEAGAQFDPEVVKAFRELMTRKADRGSW